MLKWLQRQAMISNSEHGASGKPPFWGSPNKTHPRHTHVFPHAESQKVRNELASLEQVFLARSITQSDGTQPVGSQGMRNGTTPRKNHPLWFPLRESQNVIPKPRRSFPTEHQQNKQMIPSSVWDLIHNQEIAKDGRKI